MIDPLRIEVSVDGPPRHAFAVWTEQIDRWWPRSHSVSGDPAEVVLEPRLGGRIFERTHEGDELPWGEITRWDPPNGFAYLWHIRRDRSDATDVSITFAPRQDGGTLVVIVHRGWERLGENGLAWRDANQGGWDGLLPHYLAVFTPNEQENPR